MRVEELPNTSNDEDGKKQHLKWTFSGNCGARGLAAAWRNCAKMESIDLVLHNQLEVQHFAKKHDNKHSSEHRGNVTREKGVRAGYDEAFQGGAFLE